MIPTIQTDICRVAFAVCGCFPMEADDSFLFQMVPCGLKVGSTFYNATFLARGGAEECVVSFGTGRIQLIWASVRSRLVGLK